MRWSLILCSLFALTLASYFDNLRGPLLPIFGQLFSIDYSKQSFFLVLGNLGALAGNLVLLQVVQRYGERPGALGTCVFGIFTCLLSLWITDFSRMCVFAVLLGISIAALGALANLLLIQGTDVRRRSRFYCALHMMYGFGSFLGPMGVSRLGGDGGSDWSRPLYWSIAPLLLLGITVWFRIQPSAKVEARTAVPRRLSRAQWLILLCFGFYVVGEVLSSMWLASYLVTVRQMSVNQASSYVSAFFIVMGISRFALFLSVKVEHEVGLIIGCLIVAVGFSLLGQCGFSWAFAGVGLLGPYFPLVMSRVTRVFPEQSAQLTVGILGFVQFALGIAHLTVGRLSDVIGIQKAYWLPPVFLLLALALFFWYLQLEKKHHPINP